MRTCIILQARLDSTRLPNKVIFAINEKPLIITLLKRLHHSKNVDEIITAIPATKINDKLAKVLKKYKYKYYRGSEKNVLERYYYAAKKIKANIIVRITSDCPLVDPEMIDKFLEIFKEKKIDYLSNTNPPTYPDGLDIEIFSFNALRKCFLKAKSNYDKEHVTPFIKKSKLFNKLNIVNTKDMSKERWTIDEMEDYQLIKFIFNKLSNKIKFNFNDVLKIKLKYPKIFEINNSLKRDEGSQLSYGQKLWKRAKYTIPGGTMLFSKNPDIFLPTKWPAYYKKAKGCEIWDLDNKRYIDMSLMGVGTNILGYANRTIDRSVINAIKNSNLSTLNSPHEIYLSEKLLDIHRWAEMTRFARTGGEANAIAIRIARAYSNKDKVAICGYHGWHDWYLSSNISKSKNLDPHLMGGLEPLGVPKKLKNTVFPFNYNDIDKLEKIVANNNIGVVKMEVIRNFHPKNNFLKKVRELTRRKNIILIFDECTTGFRQTYGGIHKLFGVEPDMAIFGKAIGNGYAISAVIGKSDIMKMAERTFISSTFWTERIGSVAALATLTEMEKIKSWKIITNIGKKIIKFWNKISHKHNLDFNFQGIETLASFKINSKNWIKYKTYISQEMLKEGILASNSVYPCIAHSKSKLDKYFYCFDKIASQISDCEQGKNIDEILESPICIEGFKRYN